TSATSSATPPRSTSSSASATHRTSIPQGNTSTRPFTPQPGSECAEHRSASSTSPANTTRPSYHHQGKTAEESPAKPHPTTRPASSNAARTINGHTSACPADRSYSDTGQYCFSRTFKRQPNGRHPCHRGVVDE